MLDRLVRPLLIVAMVAMALGCGALKPTPAPSPTTAPTVPPPTVTAEPTPLKPTPTPEPTPEPTPVVERPVVGYARYYRPVSLNIPKEYQGLDYTLPVNLQSTSNYAAMKRWLSAAQWQAVSAQGFVVKPAEWTQFYKLYENTRYANIPVFVTTDAIYHVYHLYFDKLLRDLEREHFIANLTALTDAMVAEAAARYEATQDPVAKETARRVWAYFVVAQQLLEETPPPIPPAVASEVTQELALIESGELTFSAVMPAPEADLEPYREDYSQYIPRGHYTRSEALKRYFRAMMWYGRINLRLASPAETRMALLITELLRTTRVNGRLAMQVWATIYDPTVFLVGKADDLGYYEYLPLMQMVFGDTLRTEDVADAAKVQRFVELARALPAPQINSMFVYIWEDKKEVTQGFRFMGQRFTLDAYVFGQLTWRNVGTLSQPRDLPSGLDVFAAFGNPEAYTILQEMGAPAYMNYDKQLQKVQGEIAALQTDSWTQNVYWNWLYALQAVSMPKGEAYPTFMRTQAWARKDLQSALGSYAELKHDTILYAKQTMAEMGGGPEEMLVRGYVEPNPLAFARLLELTKMTRQGLSQQGLLTYETDRRLSALEDELTFLMDVAQRELQGETLTEDDYTRIMYFGGWLEDMTLAAADSDEEYPGMFGDDAMAAIIADVATGVSGNVLEIGTGKINELYVVVPDGQGGFQIARGGVYSYYEFEWPASDRLTDEAWRQMLMSGSQLVQPDWTRMFIVP